MIAEIRCLLALEDHQSHWMQDPDDWVWTTPERQPQGFGLAWRDCIGRSNLMWLALAMEHPPSRPYDMRHHQLGMLLVTTGHSLLLGGLPLFDQAGSLTLAQFRNLCLQSAPNNTSLAPLLCLLANERLTHAHA